MHNPEHRHRKLSQVRAEETREAILQKAREAFAEHGFAGASIRDIAVEAGTTHSMIRYHFGTKDQLWREAVRDMFAQIESEVFSPIAEDEAAGFSARETYIRMMRRYVRYSARHPEHARITVSETIRGGDRLKWMVDEFVRSNHGDGLPRMQKLMDEGVIRKVPIESYIYGVVGMIQVPFILAEEARLAMDYDFTTDEAIERHTEAVLKLIIDAYEG